MSKLATWVGAIAGLAAAAIAGVELMNNDSIEAPSSNQKSLEPNAAEEKVINVESDIEEVAIPENQFVLPPLENEAPLLRNVSEPGPSRPKTCTFPLTAASPVSCLFRKK